MHLDDETAGSFLYELYLQTEGDLQAQVSMHVVGERVGLEKESAGAVAQELMLAELVELRTLAGGISLTGKGLLQLQDQGMVAAGSTEQTPKLSGDAVLNEEDRAVLAGTLADLRSVIAQVEAGYEVLEAMVIDVKTIEVQLLSRRAKTAVVAAVLRSLQSSCNSLGKEQTAARIDALLAEV